MSSRFRRTMKIAPGVRLNLSKTGVSARIGAKGAGVSVGTRGTTVSAGIPGSGLHVSQKLKNGGSRSNSGTSPRVSEPEPKALGVLGWLGGLAIMSGLIWLIF
ncbi:DUF4236 domain-containing protein [Rhodovulum sp.]|uniref:DUF4236 domain-containing protein n=1 Tax=Rhodovulum sp. TaxID=34009 RepID=UPI00257CA291|nr:DUF4236 domain-containing protein [Rhodovulum sp.]